MWLHALIKEWYLQFLSPLTFWTSPIFLLTHFQALSLLSIFSTSMESLVLSISLDLKLVVRKASALLPFSDCFPEVALVWKGKMTNQIKLEDSSFWMGSTKLFPWNKSFWLIASLSSKMLQANSVVLLLT